jgi:hypothetical protein
MKKYRMKEVNGFGYITEDKSDFNEGLFAILFGALIGFVFAMII